MGKSLPHEANRSFLTVPGTYVGLCEGHTAAVFERKGKTLRVFDFSALPVLLDAFFHMFMEKRVFPDMNRLLIKEFPPEAESGLLTAGFRKEMQDFVLYR